MTLTKILFELHLEALIIYPAMAKSHCLSDERSAVLAVPPQIHLLSGLYFSLLLVQL